MCVFLWPRESNSLLLVCWIQKLVPGPPGGDVTQPRGEPSLRPAPTADPECSSPSLATEHRQGRASSWEGAAATSVSGVGSLRRPEGCCREAPGLCGVAGLGFCPWQGIGRCSDSAPTAETHSMELYKVHSSLHPRPLEVKELQEPDIPSLQTAPGVCPLCQISGAHLLYDTS